MTGRIKSKQWRDALGFMLLCTLVCISAVAALHLGTRRLVLRNASLFRDRAILNAAGFPAGLPAGEITALFERHVQPDSEDPARFGITLPDGSQRTALIRSGAGLWGPIEAVICMEPDSGTLTGLAVLDHKETPGLGARISETWFMEQFRGKRPPLELVPEKTRSAADGQVDAVTGATITSRAVRDLVNRTAQELRQKHETHPGGSTP